MRRSYSKLALAAVLAAVGARGLQAKTLRRPVARSTKRTLAKRRIAPSLIKLIKGVPANRRAAQ